MNPQEFTSETETVAVIKRDFQFSGFLVECDFGWAGRGHANQASLESERVPL
jgi:hypothetical protein